MNEVIVEFISSLDSQLDSGGTRCLGKLGHPPWWSGGKRLTMEHIVFYIQTDSDWGWSLIFSFSSWLYRVRSWPPCIQDWGG
jgi:hypothetical protein